MTHKPETDKGNAPESPNSGTWVSDAPKLTRIEERVRRLRVVAPDAAIAPGAGGVRHEDFEIEGDHARRLPTEAYGIEAFTDLLRHARRYALIRMANPDGFLGGLVAETAGVIPPAIAVKTIGRDTPLNVFAAIIDLTGKGKGNIQGALAKVVGPVIEDKANIRRITGLASGQGLQDAYSGPKLDEDDEAIDFLNTLIEANPDDGELVMQMIRDITRARGGLALVHDSVILTYDEGKKLFDTMGQQNSVLASDFISLITGGGIDSVRAKDHGKPDTRVAIPAGAVRICGTAGIQPAYVAPMLKDGEQGLMKRLLKLPSAVTRDEIAEMKALRLDPEAEQMLEDSRRALADYVYRASKVESLRVSPEVQARIDEAAYSSIEDKGWVNTDPEGQQLTLQIAVAGVLSAMVGNELVDVDSMDFAGGLIALTLAMEERCAVYGEAHDSARADTVIRERIAQSLGQDLARDTIRQADLMKSAVEKILKTLGRSEDEWLTGRTLRDKCGANSEQRRAFKAASGGELHVAAIAALETDGKVEVAKAGRGLKVRLVQRGQAG